MPRQVLLIDDDQDEAILLIAALKEDGMPHVCNWASDVIMGLEMLDNMTPEIILIDYQMPGHNGLDGIRLIRAQKHLAAIPIILYSTDAGHKEEEALTTGATACIKKPVNEEGFEKLLQAIR